MARFKRPLNGSALVQDSFGEPMPILPWGRNRTFTLSIAEASSGQTVTPQAETGVVVVYASQALRVQIGSEALNQYVIPAETLIPIPLFSDLVSNALVFRPYDEAAFTTAGIDATIDVRETVA